jgi:hypothetical protein
MNKRSLAARRAELIERCAEQRTGLVYELKALRPSNALAYPLTGYKKAALGMLGAVLGLALLRKRLPALAGSSMSAWRLAQGALAMLAQYRK